MALHKKCSNLVNLFRLFKLQVCAERHNNMPYHLQPTFQSYNLRWNTVDRFQGYIDVIPEATIYFIPCHPLPNPKLFKTRLWGRHSCLCDTWAKTGCIRFIIQLFADIGICRMIVVQLFSLCFFVTIVVDISPVQNAEERRTWLLNDAKRNSDGSMQCA